MKTKHVGYFFLGVIFVVIAMIPIAYSINSSGPAPVPMELPFQATLTQNDGSPITTDPINVTFNVFDRNKISADGGDLLYSETDSCSASNAPGQCVLKNNTLSTVIGDNSGGDCSTADQDTELCTDDFGKANNKGLWLQVVVGVEPINGSDSMFPIRASGYAIQSDNSNKLAGLSQSGYPYDCEWESNSCAGGFCDVTCPAGKKVFAVGCLHYGGTGMMTYPNAGLTSAHCEAQGSPTSVQPKALCCRGNVTDF